MEPGREPTRRALLARAGGLAACLPVLLSSGSAAAQVPTWTVESRWTTSAGDGEGEGHQLLNVQDAVRLPDGRLLVLSSGTHDLRVFAADGTFLRMVGREGEGPGEFKLPRGMRLLPDGHLLVYDPGNLRVTQLDADFEIVGTERVAYEVSAMTPAFGRGRPLDNGLVPVAAYDVPMLEEIRRREGLYEDDLVVRLIRGSEVIGSVRRPRGPAYQVREGNTALTLPPPMGPFALFGWGARHVVVGSSHETGFTLYDTLGAAVATVHGVGEPRRAEAADVRDFEERFRRERSHSFRIGGVEVSTDARVERFLEEAPRGEWVPLFDEVQIDDEGLVWVREYGLSGDAVTWQILDPGTDGPISRLSHPASWEMVRPGRDHLVVRERDDLDVERVRVYRVVR